jgi:putative sigma-54 modulation protein
MFNPKICIMKVDVHAVNFTVDRKLVDFIQERMDKLEKYYDRVVSADIFLKVERTSDKENKAVEIKVNVPGDDFLVKKQCKTFEEAIELSAESLERVLVKRKEKSVSTVFVEPGEAGRGRTVISSTLRAKQ